MNLPTLLALANVFALGSIPALAAGSAAAHGQSAPPVLLAQIKATSASEEQPARKPDIHYVPTPEPLVEEMLRTAKVSKDEVVYDLGCGDGRIVIMAAQKFGARGIGIDIDPPRIKEATANAAKAGVSDRVKFLKADIFTSDFSDANVIALYLLTSINEKLRPKILAETRPGTRIVSHAFSMGPWEADASKTVEGRDMYYWVVPANLSGRWSIQGKGAPLTELTLEQTFQKLSGSAQINGAKRAIRDGKITGEAFTFTIEGGSPDAAAMTISGQLKGEELQAREDGKSGSAWTARRAPGSMRALAGGK